MRLRFKYHDKVRVGTLIATRSEFKGNPVDHVTHFVFQEDGIDHPKTFSADKITELREDDGPAPPAASQPTPDNDGPLF